MQWEGVQANDLRSKKKVDTDKIFYPRKKMTSKNQANISSAVVSITYEEIGLFPRSFNRVFDRFVKQIFSDVENLVIQEYRFYRYLFLTTLKCLFFLLFIPFLVNLIAKQSLVEPLTEYLWNTKQTEIFLNSYQQKKAFSEFQDFEEKLYFESLISDEVEKRGWLDPLESTTPSGSGQEPQPQESKEIQKKTANFKKPKIINKTLWNLVPSPSGIKEEIEFKKKDKEVFTKSTIFQTPYKNASMEQNSGLAIKEARRLCTEVHSSSGLPPQVRSTIEERLQQKTVELAIRYNTQSIEAITNFFADLLSLMTLCFLFFVLEIQINITKSFLLEVFFGLDDSKKSLIILLITDLLVGYHSSNLWELFFQFCFNHYGFPENQTGIFLLVATFPVLLDVLFKYLIFRHLNRASPATVATYHAMIE